MDEMYDMFYSGVLEDGYRSIGYSEWSELRLDEYDRWSDTRSDCYDEWSDFRSDIYDFYSDDYDVARIARSVGYEDVFVFSHAFKKEFGQSPTQFRQTR